MGNMKGTAHPVRPNAGDLKPKMIHLTQNTFRVLSKAAIDRDMNLKRFIEHVLNVLANDIERSEKKTD